MKPELSNGSLRFRSRLVEPGSAARFWPASKRPHRRGERRDKDGKAIGPTVCVREKEWQFVEDPLSVLSVAQPDGTLKQGFFAYRAALREIQARPVVAEKQR